jgi:beta-glucanase (GH16 family)
MAQQKFTTLLILLVTALGAISASGCAGDKSKPDPITPVARNPIVNIVLPLSTATLASTAPITLNARITFAENTTAKEVTLFRDGALVAVDNEAPYEWTVTDNQAGLHKFTVRALDTNDHLGEESRTLGIIDTHISATDVVWAVNAGGTSFTSVDGIKYNPDERYTTVTTRQISASINATFDPKLYQSERFGNQFVYKHTLPNGRYHLRLHFAENVYNAAGKRKFSVSAENKVIVDSLDVFSMSGNINTAYSLTIPNIEVTDGEMNIEFTGLVDTAILSALVVTKPQAAKTDWQLTWSDEFNYSGALDPTKWNYEIQPPKWVNSESQRYTDRPENVRVENGVLIIEARKDNYLGNEYSSARVHSQNKGDLLYGRVEVRAKLPAGRGTWPALWMMPTDYRGYGAGWPDSGEIDIMEHVGYDQGRIHATTHNKAYSWVNGMQHKGSASVKDATEKFHVYAVEWSSNAMHFFVDDALYFSYVNNFRGWESWPYDKNFYVILNLAIGGNWGGIEGIDASVFPARLEVDYVRFFQH